MFVSVHERREHAAPRQGDMGNIKVSLQAGVRGVARTRAFIVVCAGWARQGRVN